MPRNRRLGTPPMDVMVVACAPQCKRPNLVVPYGRTCASCSAAGRALYRASRYEDGGAGLLFQGVARGRAVRRCRAVTSTAGAVQASEPGRASQRGIRCMNCAPSAKRITTFQVRCAYRSSIPETINDLMRSPLKKAQAGLQYMFTRRRAYCQHVVDAHAITRAQPGAQRPDVMVRIYHISGESLLTQPRCESIRSQDSPLVASCCTRSRGAMHCRSADPHAFPSIQPNYHHMERCATTVSLLRLIRRIAKQPTVSVILAGASGPRHRR